MAWNEPGDNQDNKDRDPWSDKKKPSKPKDLDDALNQLQRKFTSLIRRKGTDESNGGGTGNSAIYGVGIIIAAVVVIWVLTGFFVVQAAGKAVILRFGKYSETTGPGLHWIPRIMDSETAVNVQTVHTYTYPDNGDTLMLTQDQNIVAVAISVQYRVENPQKFLFNVVNPVVSMQQATASALRQVVGQMNIDAILTTGREQLRADVRTQLDETLQRYQSGLKVVNVLLKSAQAPEAVRAAFDDAVKAQEDEKRYVNQAQAYTMKVVPLADGQAKRILAAASAYQQRVVLNAQANVAPYLALLPEYKASPGVMRERMYLDALQTVFEKSSKILVESDGRNNNLLYLPIDKLLQADTVPASMKPVTAQSAAPFVPSGIQTGSSSSVRPTRDQIVDYGNLGESQ